MPSGCTDTIDPITEPAWLLTVGVTVDTCAVDPRLPQRFFNQIKRDVKHSPLVT